MKIFRNKKDIPSVVALLVLIAMLVFIYLKPQLITSNLNTNENNIEDVIYSNIYKLDLTEQEKAWLKENPKIKMGIDRAFPPFGRSALAICMR